MEFPGVTVGGAYAGTAGESSSFKIGLFARSVRSVEMVLGDGDVIQASKDNNADLFYEAKEFVRTTYHPLPSVKDTNQSHDYVDGIVFSKDHGVVVTGEMTDENPGRAQTFSHSTDP
ncbi:hypothetical protein F4820DRAFT_452331 [Hypoxylon rubiginosum]|uniref:Uncharacterized protein n=1 Tax=Hypoxylon rubiginosum TaxID=110542 RepID=A0ACB9YNT1_9PEZI|nr:hypothetical protein F4820DRAFT_452331 [Hypoxylon rubiginosum]